MWWLTCVMCLDETEGEAIPPFAALLTQHRDTMAITVWQGDALCERHWRERWE